MAKAPRVSVKFEVNSTGYTAAVNKAKAQMIDFGEASKRVNHAMITDVQATSGALRLIDGGIQNNIRSAERFLASIKGVGAAVQAIYPMVGAIAVAAVIGRGVVELTKFQQRAKDAGDQFKQSWQEMVNASRLGNDELAKTNIELENQIAKLEGRHENTLALELMESRIEATKLAQAAESAREKVDQLFKEKGVGFGSMTGVYRLIFGQEASTSATQKLMKGYDDRIAQVLQERADALHTGNQGAASAAQQKYEALLKEQQGTYRTWMQGSRAISGGAGGDQSANIEALQAGLNLSYEASDRIGEEAQNKKDQARLKALQDGKEATQKMMERYRNQFAELQSSMTVAPGEEADQFRARELAAEADFWAQKLAIAKKGTEAYREIQNQLSAVLREVNQQYAAAQKESLDLEKQRGKFIEGSFGDSLDLSRDESAVSGLRSGGADAVSMLEAMNKSVAIGRQNADAWRETQIQIGLAAGTISKYDAAMQTYELHREQHARDLEDLENERRKLQQRYGPESSASLEGRAAYQQFGDRYQQANGEWLRQQALDQQSVVGQTPFGAWKTALDQFVQQSRDVASQVRDIWTNALSSVNDEIVKVISTRHNYNTRVEFGNIGASIFRGVAGAGLRGAEGAALHALGLGGGKAGSESNPLWVRIAGTGKSAVSGVASVAQSAASGIGGFLGKVGGFFTGLGFAEGGMPPVGMASLVGERGPELFVPHAAGTVIPNDRLGGVHHHTHVKVDARGATDPAMVDARIRRAVPSIAAAVTHAQQNGKARMPMSRRS